MKKIETKIKDCFVIETEKHSDYRGYFQETFHEKKYKKYLPANTNFVQDNLSYSKKNTLRGIHVQKNKPQGKLVRVVKGLVMDVAIDLRINSKTFSHHIVENLSDQNNKQLWIPEGFGHAFLVLSEDAILEYKCTDFYFPEDEITINYKDKKININWPLTFDEAIISTKDLNGITLENYLKII